MLQVENLGYVYKAFALQQVNFALEIGQLFTMVGANGSGKTTLFKILAGLLKPASGALYLNDKQISLPNQVISVALDQS